MPGNRKLVLDSQQKTMSNINCADCNLSVPEAELKNHIRLKLVYFPFLCYVCQQEFLSADLLENIHFKSEHPSAKVRVLTNLDEKKERLLAQIFEASLKGRTQVAPAPSQTTPPATSYSNIRPPTHQDRRASLPGRAAECTAEDIIELHPKTEIPYQFSSHVSGEAAKSSNPAPPPPPKRQRRKRTTEITEWGGTAQRTSFNPNPQADSLIRVFPEQSSTGEPSTQRIDLQHPGRASGQAARSQMDNISATRIRTDMNKPLARVPIQAPSQARGNGTEAKGKENPEPEENSRISQNKGLAGIRQKLPERRSLPSESVRPSNQPQSRGNLAESLSFRNSPGGINIQRVLAKQRAQQAAAHRQQPTKPCSRLERTTQPEGRGPKTPIHPSVRRLSTGGIGRDLIESPLNPVRAVFRSSTGLHEPSSELPKNLREILNLKRRLSDGTNPGNEGSEEMSPKTPTVRPPIKRTKRVYTKKVKSVTTPDSESQPTENAAERSEVETPHSLKGTYNPVPPNTIRPPTLFELGLKPTISARKTSKTAPPKPKAAPRRPKAKPSATPTAAKPTKGCELKGRPALIQVSTKSLSDKTVSDSAVINPNARLTRSRAAGKRTITASTGSNQPSGTDPIRTPVQEGAKPITEAKTPRNASRNRKSKETANKMISNLANSEPQRPSTEKVPNPVEIDIKPPVPCAPKTPARRCGASLPTSIRFTRSKSATKKSVEDSFMKFPGMERFFDDSNLEGSSEKRNETWSASSIFQDAGIERSVQLMKILFDPNLPGNPDRYISLLRRVQDLNYGDPFTCGIQGCNHRFSSPEIRVAEVERHVLQHLNRHGYCCMKCEKGLENPIEHSREGPEHQIKDFRKDFEASLIEGVQKCIPQLSTSSAPTITPA